MTRHLGLILGLVLAPGFALAQDDLAAALTNLPADQCREILISLDGSVAADANKDGPSLAGQIQQSVELYCRAARMDEELVALGVDPEQPPKKPVRSILTGNDDENRARDLLTDRANALEGAQIYLELAVASDPDAANDLLRRLLGRDPGGQTQ